MVEVALVGLLALIALLAYALLQRRDAGAMGLWFAAAGALAAAGLCDRLVGLAGWVYPLRCVLAGLSASLLLAGALVYCGRRPPSWLVPLGFAVGTARALILHAGLPELSTALVVAFEASCLLLAAGLLFQTTRGRRVSLAERALAPAALALAVLCVASLLGTPAGEALPLELLQAWVVAVPLSLTLQVAAVSNRRQARAQSRQLLLERRVAERTAELSRSMEALRESQERYRTVSELSSDYSFAVRVTPDLSIDFEWINRPLRAESNFEIGFVEGTRWLSAIPEGDREELVQGIRAVMAGRSDQLDLRFVSWQGETRWVQIRFRTREREPDGSVRLVGAGRDVSALKNAEGERRRLDALVRDRQRVESLGLLAGGIAHDFNNVLTIIRGNARLALDELGGGSPLRERLARIEATAEYASELTEQMLAYSGKASVELQPLDLSRLVREALDLMRASVAEKNRLDVDLAQRLPGIRGDNTQLRQVLLNLVGNASEAMLPESGSIEVRTGTCHLDARALEGAFPALDPTPGEYVYLEVRDTGPGIDEELKARIFEPFFTTKASGRGLGLAAVFGIVSAHRGVVQIEAARGEGTTFRVLFPAAAGEPTAEQPRAGAVAAEPRSGVILVVDDDEWVLELAREFLSRAGLEVWTARGGRAAVELLREHPQTIAAVVLDLVMPDMSGEATLLALREIRPDLPAILASGYDSNTSAERLAGQGVVRFVQKPYAPEQLTEQVREALTS